MSNDRYQSNQILPIERVPDELLQVPAIYQNPSLVSLQVGSQDWTPLVIDLGGREIAVAVASRDKPIVRQRLKEIVRRDKRRASNAGNAANTAQQIGVGIGGALAVGGIIALLTAPISIGAAIATGVGAVIASGGLLMGHWMNAKRFEHEERIDRFTDAAEELR